MDWTKLIIDLLIAFGPLMILTWVLEDGIFITWEALQRLAYEMLYRRVKRQIEVGYAIENTTQLILEEMERRGELPK